MTNENERKLPSPTDVRGIYAGAKPREAVTSDEMRKEIFRLRREDPLVGRVMNYADCTGMSGEDRYLALAYYALVDRSAFREAALDMCRFAPFIPVVKQT